MCTCAAGRGPARPFPEDTLRRWRRGLGGVWLVSGITSTERRVQSERWCTVAVLCRCRVRRHRGYIRLQNLGHEQNCPRSRSRGKGPAQLASVDKRQKGGPSSGSARHTHTYIRCDRNSWCCLLVQEGSEPVYLIEENTTHLIQCRACCRWNKRTLAQAGSSEAGLLSTCWRRSAPETYSLGNAIFMS